MQPYDWSLRTYEHSREEAAIIVAVEKLYRMS